MRVRFKKEYALDTNNRIAYELVSDEIEWWCTEPTLELSHYGTWKRLPFYRTKLLGLIPTYKMEETEDETDIPAIDILVSVTNNK